MLDLAFLLLTAAATGPRADAVTIAGAVDSLAARLVARQIVPAIGVAVTMDGRTILTRGHGLADATAGIPADDRSFWYIASTTKSFTGFGVSLLAHQGALRIDAPITTTLPRVRWHADAHPDSLTLGNFLSHTHHLREVPIVMNAAFTGAIPESQWPGLLERTPPTGRHDLVYGNLGYNVAAMAIDAVRPEGWRSYLERNVYQPAGLRETFARVSGLDPRRIARSHDLKADGRFVTEAFLKTDATMNSAGGHLTTLGDLARWTIVQMDGGMIDGRRVFPAEAVALSHRLIARHTVEASRRFSWFDRVGWAAGWDVGSYESEPMVSRFGAYQSMRSHLSFLPARRIGVVSVVTGGSGQAADICATLAYDLEAGRPDARARAEQRFADLEGRRATALRRIAGSDSARAARQREPLGRPLADFTGGFSQPDYGEIRFVLEGDQLRWRWGVLSGPAEIYDAAKRQMRIEIAGSGTVVTFDLPDQGPARAIEVEGVRYLRAR
jgi:CubicO group peptidase (beta-lactamase class C family)